MTVKCKTEILSQEELVIKLNMEWFLGEFTIYTSLLKWLSSFVSRYTPQPNKSFKLYSAGNDHYHNITSFKKQDFRIKTDKWHNKPSIDNKANAHILSVNQ